MEAATTVDPNTPKQMHLVAPEPKWDSWRLVTVSHGGVHTMNFKTREEAEAQYAKFEQLGRCGECNEVLNDNYCEPYKTNIRDKHRCFSCLHWLGYVETFSNPTHAVVNGHHFVISPDKPKGYQGFVGHGGAEFLFRFHDGRVVVSRNVWAQGKVPEHFRDRLPDNAAFAKRGHVRIGPFAGYGGAGSADGECEF